MVDVKKVVEQEMPGWTLESQPPRRDDADRPIAEPDMVGPDDEALRKKYLPRGSKRTKERPSTQEQASDPEDVVRSVGKPTREADSEAASEQPAEDLAWGRIKEKNPRDSSLGSKSILFDKATGKVKGVQG